LRSAFDTGSLLFHNLHDIVEEKDIKFEEQKWQKMCDGFVYFIISVTLFRCHENFMEELRWTWPRETSTALRMRK
jgi:hypothetical protein